MPDTRIVPCSECQSPGSVKPDCPTCGGVGTIVVETCDACGGSNDPACGRCGGHGVLDATPRSYCPDCAFTMLGYPQPADCARCAGRGTVRADSWPGRATYGDWLARYRAAVANLCARMPDEPTRLHAVADAGFDAALMLASLARGVRVPASAFGGHCARLTACAEWLQPAALRVATDVSWPMTPGTQFGIFPARTATSALAVAVDFTLAVHRAVSVAWVLGDCGGLVDRLGPWRVELPGGECRDVADGESVHGLVAGGRRVFRGTVNARDLLLLDDPRFDCWRDAAALELRTHTLPPETDWPLYRMKGDATALRAVLADELRRTAAAPAAPAPAPAAPAKAGLEIVVLADGVPPTEREVKLALVRTAWTEISARDGSATIDRVVAWLANDGRYPLRKSQVSEYLNELDDRDRNWRNSGRTGIPEKSVSHEIPQKRRR